MLRRLPIPPVFPALIALLLLPQLTACATSKDQPVVVSNPTIEYRPVKIPDTLLRCKELPDIPDLAKIPKAARDPAVAELLVALYDVATDCKGALAAVARFQQRVMLPVQSAVRRSGSS